MSEPHHSVPLRKSSTVAASVSLKSIQRRSSLNNIDGESAVSELSFKHWHKRMQARHESLGGTGFRVWRWCYKGCKPCRWFDSIPYDYKICRCWLQFKTFKSIGTFFMIAGFSYILMYAIFGDEILPGGTIFFLFLLFLAAYFFGLVLIYAGLPPMVGHIVTGILYGNIPKNWLPPYDDKVLESVICYVEFYSNPLLLTVGLPNSGKLVLIIAIIRAGLLLDMSRIKGHVPFIIKMSVLPIACEQFLLLMASHYLLHLPWAWSALQGSLVCIVSLATVTSIMEKNRLSGYGEDKHLSTVLIAAASADVIFGFFSYIVCLSFIFPGKWPYETNSSIERTLANIGEQVLIGLSAGLICGFLIAFFPDKRNVEAAIVRILVLGLGSFSIALICYKFDMIAGGALGVIILCLVASNMWAELGWHDRNNPVQYFYTTAYYFTQPIALSLVGFSMNFHGADVKNVGLSFAVVFIGVVGKQIVCYIATYESSFPTTMKEKIFICIAWFSKGTFQALLAYAVEYMIEQNKLNMNESSFTIYQIYAKIVKNTTVLGILLTTPLACYGMAFLSPILLTRVNITGDRIHSSNPSGLHTI